MFQGYRCESDTHLNNNWRSREVMLFCLDKPWLRFDKVIFDKMKLPVIWDKELISFYNFYQISKYSKYEAFN